MRKKRLAALMAALLAASSLAACSGQTPGAASAGENTEGQEAAPAGNVELEIYYPVGVGGTVSQLIEQLAQEYQEETEGVTISSVFAGSYDDTLQKLITSYQGGNAPQLTILSNNTILTMLSMDMVLPLDDLIAQDGGSEYIDDFFPGFMANCVFDGKIYSIPFQRSTLLMFYNKDHFREVGLDPESPPKTWEELAEYGQKLTKFDENGNAERWGVMIPSSGAWDFGPYVISNSANGENIMSDDGKSVMFDTPENVEALQFLRDLGTVYKASPEGVIEMDTAPANFIEQKTSMVQLSSGNIANIDSSVTFDYGIATLPYSKRPASIAGGGNLYMIKGSTEEEQKAAWKFIRWLTEPERQAQWNVDTGYVAARKSAFETDIMEQYFKVIPQAEVAREQLDSCYNEIRVYESARINDALTRAYDSVMTGAAEPQAALTALQTECDEILAPYNQ